MKPRDRHDCIIVQEKLDGSCVSIAKIGGAVIPLIRAGYTAISSPFAMHRFFHEWVVGNSSRFNALLNEGERVVGEWLIQAHGTKYALPHEPFVAFDIMREHDRLCVGEFAPRCAKVNLTVPKVLSWGPPASVESILEILEPSGHGALDPVEGAVWRVERKGTVDFLGKYVRSDKIDGKYLESLTNAEPVYNTWK